MKLRMLVMMLGERRERAKRNVEEVDVCNVDALNNNEWSYCVAGENEAASRVQDLLFQK